MGLFLSALCSLLFLFCFAMFFMQLLLDLKILKNKSTIDLFFKNAIKTISTGFILLFIGFVIYNFTKGKANYFDFSKIWNTHQNNKWLTGILDFKTSNLSSFGIFFLYPLLAGGIGKMLFDTFIPTAFVISFVSACMFTHFLYLVTKKFTNELVADKLVIIALFFPFAISLFMPTNIPLVLGLSMMSIYFLFEDNLYASIILAVLSCVTGILGFIALLLNLIFINKKTRCTILNDFKLMKLSKSIQNDTSIFMLSYLTISAVLTGVVIFLRIGGVM